jgi:hypothetical protein
MNPKSMTFDEIIEALPPELRSQVKTYAEYLLTKHLANPGKSRRLRQDWANALKNDPDSSVDLQHLALNWRSEDT